LFKKIRNRFPIKGEFARNALTLTVGTSVAQAFPMLFYPILGRIFTPAEFGLLATLSSITAILTVIASGKYESSILIANTKKEAADIVGLVLTLSFVFLFFAFIILQLSAQKLSGWFNEPELHKWLFICPITAFVTIIFNCYNEWCVRNKYFVNLSWNKITNAAATTLSKVFLGFVKITGNGLVAGDVIGRTISAGTCVYRAIKKDKDTLVQISYKRFKPISLKYIEFPKFTMPDQLLSQIGGTFPILFIGAYYNSIEVGYYAMTMNVLSIPISVIGAAVRDVFRQRANDDYIKRGNCTVIYKRLLKNLSLAGIVGSIPLFFLLPGLFSFVLGKQWLVAGEYSQILLPMITLSFISMSLSGVLIITGKMKISMYWQIYYVLITIISLLLGLFISKDVKVALIFFAVGRSSAYLLYIFLSYKFSKGKNIQFDQMA